MADIRVLYTLLADNRFNQNYDFKHLENLHPGINGQILLLGELGSLRPGDSDGSRIPLHYCRTGSTGIGKNLKLGFTYAIDNDFDLVILLNAGLPDDVRRLLDAWLSEQPAVVGYSLAEMAGTRGIRLTEQVLSLFHRNKLPLFSAGPIGYSTAYLRSIPFYLNAEDERFQLQLLLQAHYLRATVLNLGASQGGPVAQGTEMKRLSTAKFLLVRIQYIMHRIGIFCSLNYRDLDPVTYRNKADILYSSHQEALNMISNLRAKRVLDIGCGPGFLSERCTLAGIETTGIDSRAPLPGKVRHFIQHDLEDPTLPFSIYDYDVVLLLDVIEHLANPEEFMLRLRHEKPSLDHTPRLIITTPNIAFFTIRLMLLTGSFNYAERGILDITHKRLFTRKSLLRLLRDCGYDILEIRPLGVPFAAVIPGPIGRVLGWLCQGLANIMPRMFSFQFLVLCRPQPTIKSLLERDFHPVVVPSTNLQ